ncbi:MAG: hypothetical protein MK171_11580 [Pirellulales bacterium]|nr:hypothetical protein [Pirellulales bacterium]
MSYDRSRRNIVADETGQDSFLDVVANVVGVLIILVMIVGLQASQSVLKNASLSGHAAKHSNVTSEEDVEKLRQELAEATEQALASRRTVRQTTRRASAIRSEAVALDRQRIALAMHRTVVEEDIANRREKLDSVRTREFDVQRQLVESQLQLEKMMQEQLAIDSTPSTVEVESVPTPLAKEVDGEAIHLRLRHGLVSVVPFRQLQNEVENHLGDMRRRLHTREGIQDVFGPIDGYRLKFVVQKSRPPDAVSGPLMGQLERSRYVYEGDFLPNSEKIGQNVEQALMPGAALHSHLLDNRRTRAPVVVWLYIDSFDEFRILKSALWKMSYAVAIRPLQPGTAIRVSSRGTRASAQ